MCIRDRDEMYINPNTGTQELLNDRPPLVLRATAPKPAGGTLAFTVIVNHLRSLSGIDDATPNGTGTEGSRVRAKRQAQAVSLANLIQGFQTGDSAERIITVGDMNAFPVNDDALAVTNRFAYARDDADFAVKNYELANELRLSDHDQPIVYLSLGGIPAGSVIISEFRFHGPAFVANGPNGALATGGLDEYVELYNNTDSPITVNS